MLNPPKTRLYDHLREFRDEYMQVPVREKVETMVTYRGVEHSVERENTTGNYAVHAWDRDYRGGKERIVSKVFTRTQAMDLMRSCSPDAMHRGSSMDEAMIIALAEDIAEDVRDAMIMRSRSMGSLHQYPATWIPDGRDPITIKGPEKCRKALATKELESLPEYGTF